MQNTQRSKIRKRLVALTGILFVLGGGSAVYFYDTGPGTALTFDHEATGPGGELITPSTQSINRYASVLRSLDRLIDIRLSEDRRLMSLEVGSDNTRDLLLVSKLQASYLTPLLPYPLENELDSFDYANLMLGEYSRTGVELSYQQSNTLFGYFNTTEGLLDTEGKEYSFVDNQIQPNARVRPTRFAVTNNCLQPGLWEFSATDSAGEMYHSWFNMPQDKYFDMIRGANNLAITDDKLSDALSYREDLTDVPLKLDRLRSAGPVLISTRPVVATNKEIGGYSTQDSRRKVQKGYFEILRNKKVVQPATFADLKPGATFKLRKFVPPGIYSAYRFEFIPYDPNWSNVAIRQVTPRTRYRGGPPPRDEFGYIEIILHAERGNQAIIMGNIPISLLVEQEDLRIPGFGVGILPPSELIERRYLRIKEGSVPRYAYQAQRDKRGERWMLVNNHEYGIEQIFLRLFRRDDKVYLRITLVAYERIVDLLELEVPLEGELAEKIKSATRAYKPPIYRVYQDSNII